MGRKDDDDDEDDEDMGDKLVAPPDFHGPTHDRKCTDVFCLLILVISWAAMTFLGVQALMSGDPRLLLYPLDFEGNVCGTDFVRNGTGRDMTDYPYIVYINNFGGGVCVESCPSLKGEVADDMVDIYSLVTYSGMFQVDGAQLNSTFVQMANYSNEYVCTTDNCYPNNDPVESWTSEGVSEGQGFAFYVGDTQKVLNFCILTADASDKIKDLTGGSDNTTLPSGQTDAQRIWNDLYADIYTARDFVFGFGFGLALVISFIYIGILRLPLLLNAVIWGSIFLTIGMVVAIGAYLFYTAGVWEADAESKWSDNSIQASRITAYVMWGIAAFLFFLMICLRKQIQLAIGCVKETGKAVHRMPIIIVVPVVQGVAFILFVLVFVIYSLYLASNGEITTQSIDLPTSDLPVLYRTYEFTDYIYYALWYLLFCFFWTSNFIVAYGDMVVAMAIAKWYFTRDKKETGNLTVLSSFYDTGRYHMGTLAFGSLILAIIQLIRAILAKIQKEVKKADSKIANCLLCCCQCCLWCFEQCIRFLNKNAYIQTAMFGTPFCTSAREAFFLILRNIGRIGAVSYVSGAVLIIGKLFISSVTTGLSYYIMVELIGEELNHVWGPTVLVFLIAYFISDMFLDVFEMGISTILQCLIADEEMYDGDECFAEGALQRWIDKYEENFND